MGPSRGYTIGRYALELDHTSAGWLFGAEGGGRSAEVVLEKLSQEHHVRKHIAGIKYEDITITCGAGMSKAFYEWVKASFEDKAHRVNGAIHACDFDGKIHRTLEFHQALISEIGFPALDASSKDAAKLTLKFSPEWTKTKAGDGHKISPSEYSMGQGHQKKWSPANFRLRIDDLDHTCKYVNKVEGLTIKQKVVENPLGEMRLATREPAALEIPNLVITTSESHSEQLYKWEEKFIIHGHNSDEHEKTATLEYLTPNLEHTLFTVEMRHVGLFKVAADKMESHGENIRRVRAEMYVEEMDFKYGEGSTYA
jgi:hypothetical protein